MPFPAVKDHVRKVPTARLVLSSSQFHLKRERGNVTEEVHTTRDQIFNTIHSTTFPLLYSGL